MSDTAAAYLAGEDAVEHPSPATPSTSRKPRDNYSRKSRSLSLLCEHFIARFCKEVDFLINIESASTALQVERRRIYDILNVLDAFSMIQKHLKGQYIFKGANAFRKKLDSLLVEAQHELQSIQGQEDNKQERSMTRLTQRFAQMFLLSPNKTLELSNAAAALLGVSENDGKTKTKIRRLYDIANIMSAMGIIQKLPSLENNTLYMWLGADGLQSKIDTLEIPDLPERGTASMNVVATTDTGAAGGGGGSARTAGASISLPLGGNTDPTSAINNNIDANAAVTAMNMMMNGLVDAYGVAIPPEVLMQLHGVTSLPGINLLNTGNVMAAAAAAANTMQQQQQPAGAALADGNISGAAQQFLPQEMAAHLVQFPLFFNFPMPQALVAPGVNGMIGSGDDDEKAFYGSAAVDSDTHKAASIHIKEDIHLTDKDSQKRPQNNNDGPSAGDDADTPPAQRQRRLNSLQRFVQINAKKMTSNGDSAVQVPAAVLQGMLPLDGGEVETEGKQSGGGDQAKRAAEEGGEEELRR